jgi:hypothetical protein
VRRKTAVWLAVFLAEPNVALAKPVAPSIDLCREKFPWETGNYTATLPLGKCQNISLCLQQPGFFAEKRFNQMSKRQGMSRKYNTNSPSTILSPCELNRLQEWYLNEMSHLPQKPIREIARLVITNVDDFIKWPTRAILLWSGSTRAIKYHKYPKSIQLLRLQMKLRNQNLPLDTRVNGPSAAAFIFAGGQRPVRYGSTNRWSIHHIYSGKFPYQVGGETLHAVKDGFHCTQSAGLVAIHPIADQMCDEFPAMSWYLRAIAFLKFNYDPDRVFSKATHDKYGFVGKTCTVIPIERSS